MRAEAGARQQRGEHLHEQPQPVALVAARLRGAAQPAQPGLAPVVRRRVGDRRAVRVLQPALRDALARAGGGADTAGRYDGRAHVQHERRVRAPGCRQRQRICAQHRGGVRPAAGPGAAVRSWTRPGRSCRAPPRAARGGPRTRSGCRRAPRPARHHAPRRARPPASSPRSPTTAPARSARRAARPHRCRRAVPARRADRSGRRPAGGGRAGRGW